MRVGASSQVWGGVVINERMREDGTGVRGKVRNYHGGVRRPRLRQSSLPLVVSLAELADERFGYVCGEEVEYSLCAVKPVDGL